MPIILILSGRFLRRNIFEKYLSKFFADKYFSAARFEKYGKRLTVQIFIFLVLMAGSEGVSIRGDRGKKEIREHFQSVVSVHFEYCTIFVVSRTFSVLCPRN